MTGCLLHLSASPRGAQSQSRKAGAQFVRHLLAPGDLMLIRRDLGAEPPPAPGAAFIQASLAGDEARSAADHDALAYSETLLDELERANLVVIDTPMHNFTLPAVLKAWIDYVVRPNRSFGFSSRGKVPLLKNRPVRVIIACGGRFSGPYPQQDFLTPYLRYVFGVIGLTDIEFLLLEQVIRAEGQAAAALLAEDWIAKQITLLAG